MEYTHKTADGDVLQQSKAHNTVTVEGLETAMNRLIDDGSITAGGTAAFDNILLMKTDQSAAPATDFPVFADDILLLVDGAGADSAHANPADGTFSATGGGSGNTTDGAGTVAVTFTEMGSSGGPAAALQMRLVNSTPRDTVTETVNVSLAETLATIAISVDLAPTDTLTVTWTIDIN